MDFSLSEEQETAKQVAASIFQPRSSARVDAEPPPEGEGWFDRQAWDLLAEANLLGLSLSEDVGGSGYGLLETCSLLEEQGRHLIRIPGIDTIAVAAPAVDRFGSAEQRSALLPDVTSGRTILAAALVEPRSYDPFEVQTRARSTETGWLLDGEKHCVPFAEQADAILVPARTAENGIVVFVLPPDANGVTLSPQETTNGQPESALSLDRVSLAREDVLGGSPEDGPSILRWLVNRATVGTCAVQLGVADQALQMTAKYTSEREQFGRPIGTFQAVAVRAANAYFDVQSMRVTLWQAAWRLQEGLNADYELGVAKFWAAEAGQRVTASAQHLHGGIGVDMDYPLHRYTLWSKRNELALGGANQQLAYLGGAFASAPQGEAIEAFA